VAWMKSLAKYTHPNKAHVYVSWQNIVFGIVEQSIVEPFFNANTGEYITDMGAERLTAHILEKPPMPEDADKADPKQYGMRYLIDADIINEGTNDYNRKRALAAILPFMTEDGEFPDVDEDKQRRIDFNDDNKCEKIYRTADEIMANNACELPEIPEDQMEAVFEDLKMHRQECTGLTQTQEGTRPCIQCKLYSKIFKNIHQ
jgi:hypothetical protein